MAAPPGPLPEAELRRVEGVRRRLESAAGTDGFLRFDRFLEIALYAPGLGYYAHPGLARGRAGDYYTAPGAHPIFGATLARRIRSEFDRLGRPEAFRIVEVGSGDGTLARDVRAAWPRDRPAPEYLRIDPFASASEGAEAPEAPDRAGPPLSSLAELAPLVGVVLANELLDALPFRRRIRRDGRWRELVVEVAGTGLRWAESDAGPGLPGEPDSGVVEGSVMERSPVAEAWVRELADTLSEGSAILIDYGAEQSELLGRPAGTLQAIRGHRVDEPPLANPGAADLSAWVNFTRLRAAARTAGLRETAYRSQAEALAEWGLEAVRDEAIRGAESAEAEVRLRLAVKSLAFGFANFRVLELAAPGGPAT